ncbi:2Fe-2S iron-sulfur cluster binding domain-containing protein, partial [Candidatus Bipolaricaulota bacterium]|nr:2Fe-2S iron-sulfur cluster binding domain-containing protein [Candidatus Bipolaricaulota bacterium]
MTVVRVTFLPENRCISVPVGTTIAEAARQANIAIVAPCDGAGTCGRCRVLLADRGSVLACLHRIDEDLAVEIPATSRPGSLTVHLTSNLKDPITLDALDPLGSGEGGDAGGGNNYGLALDIGTSTVACELVDLNTGRVLMCAGRANSQAAFGAEVTRRIEHVEDHGHDDL